MKMIALALALLALAACKKGPENGEPTTETGLTPAEASGAENNAGSYPTGPGAVPGSAGVGATGVEEPIDQPPSPDTPTK